ncbi:MULTISPECIES: hypothetical protein [unclassified Mesorhizobium]|uniref:hypothetical protein n=1 Tax=unclassified Mesorhizobium TaxID=325217 RepID=UPI00333D1339
MARSVEHVFKDHLRLRSAGDLEQNLRHSYADVVLLAANPNLVGHDAARVSSKHLRGQLPEGEFKYLSKQVRGPTHC